MRCGALVGALAVALTFVACGGGSSTASRAGAGQANERAVEITGPHGKMKVRIPPGPPPKKLVVRDLRKGSGLAVRSVKDEILVNYAGIEYPTGVNFYDSWDQSGPSRFILEETHPGWERGLIGMRAGGLRELITPPRLEYHTTTLIYIIEMVRVRHPGQ